MADRELIWFATEDEWAVWESENTHSYLMLEEVIGATIYVAVDLEEEKNHEQDTK